MKRTKKDIQLIHEYLDNVILERYRTLDASHSIPHITAVWKRGQEIMHLVKEPLDELMVKICCYYHDIGMEVSRKNHGMHSGVILEQDEVLKKYFSKKEIQIMKEAVEDHSSTNGRIPRNTYGKIVKDADKDNDVIESLYRAYSYSKNNKLGNCQEEWLEETFKELNLRFGTNGIVQYYILTKETSDFYREMNALALDKESYLLKMQEVIALHQITA